MKTLKIIIILVLVPSISFGAWSSDLAFKVTKDITTSAGVARLATVLPINSTVAKSMARQAVAGGAKLAVANVIGTVAILGVTAYVTYNMDSWLDDLLGADIYEGQQGTIPLTNGNYFHFRKSPTGQNHQDLYAETTVVVHIWSGTSITVDAAAHGTQERRIGSSDKVHVWQYKTTSSSTFPSDWTSSSNTAPYVAWQDASVVVQFEGSYQPAPLNRPIDNTKVDTWVNNNRAKFQAVQPEILVQMPVPTDPAGKKYDLPSVPGSYQYINPTDPVTDKPYDPYTNEDQSDITDDDLGTLTRPGIPEVPVLDTAIETPETLPISDLILTWIASAPILSIFDDFEVSASGNCNIPVSIPTGIGGNVSTSIDFCTWGDHFNSLGTLVLIFAQIYALLIIFKGG